jgi:hypothetical protein
MIGNTQLVDHGIQNEKSDLRAHVGVEAGIVYVFSTAKAQEIIESGKYKLRHVRSKVNGQHIYTATGYAVPVTHMNPMEIYAKDIIEQAHFADKGYESSADKGRKAQWTVEQLLKLGKFPLPTTPLIVSDVELQRSGFDLIVKGQWVIEVKCDWRAGQFNPLYHDTSNSDILNRILTGNLFLQIAECNPLKQH